MKTIYFRVHKPVRCYFIFPKKKNCKKSLFFLHFYQKEKGFSTTSKFPVILQLEYRHFNFGENNNVPNDIFFNMNENEIKAFIL